jgi:ABC-2 type transport system permease protein
VSEPLAQAVRHVRFVPALLRAGFAEAVAYRSEFVVWILSTNMPLIMLLLWTRVAQEAPVGRFGQKEFVAYFLVTLVVRLLSGAWVAYEMTFEIRDGSLAQRLVKPLHPFAWYAAQSLAAWPLRLIMIVPVIVVAGAVVGRSGFAHDPWHWAIGLSAVVGSWAIQFLAGVCIGTLALYWQSALSLFDLWLAMFFVFSGYLLPLELFPPAVHRAILFTPFPYLIALPVESILGLHPLRETAVGLLRQWAWVVVLLSIALALWRNGLRRFQAFGG